MSATEADGEAMLIDNMGPSVLADALKTAATEHLVHVTFLQSKLSTLGEGTGLKPEERHVVAKVFMAKDLALKLLLALAKQLDVPVEQTEPEGE